MKRNPEKLNLCVHKLSVGCWRVSGYLFGKPPPTKKMPGISPFAGLSPLLAFAWCSRGGGNKLSKSPKSCLWLSPPEPICQSTPHQLAALPGDCAAAGNCWSATGWSYLPLSCPKCWWCLGLLLELGTWWVTFAGEVRQHARVRGTQSQATEFDPFIIVSVIVIIIITTATTAAAVIFQHYFFKFH